MAFIIHLICCGISGAMCAHLDVWFTSWEYWVFIALPIVSYYCGRHYEANNKGGK